ncbi:CDP-glycerol glycerophosphotransferase family protein [Azonexus sp.]|uniref:CDP-glycerol glycerophosphotransferase family protein n=1 Tax=Azonexus sp. TaxID=1872668 RepID=UPI002826953D|nr:CDP-glycerol glycerophosphotransferase family protein [Azonexus sp.]MDR1995201.1 CDP-glycerol glycerophosphotransferase family protein [Azonexus sp.]
MTSTFSSHGLSQLPILLLYLDPGTGSLLFSIVMGAVTTAFFVLKGVWFNARAYLRKGGETADVSSEKQALVIYSEGKQYANTFRPLLKELELRGIACLYLSSDETDPLLQSASSIVKTRCIGNGHSAWGYLNTLRADVCLMTTPGLDVLQIRRSRHVKHYSHVIHSPTDKAFNRPYSFDYFDSIFVCGPHEVRTLRYLENLRHSKAKSIFLAGCVYYDEMAAAIKTAKRSNASATPRVLVAPTWGKNGLLTRFGMRLLAPLRQSGMHVTVRPHPQSQISEPEVLLELKTATDGWDNLIWDDTSSPLAAMADSDVLVSDISGIVFDYAFLTEKPVITLSFQPEKRGFEASDLPYEPWELSVFDVVGRQLAEDRLEELPQQIAAELSSPARASAIRRLREEYVVNFGAAAPHVVDQLESLLGYARPQVPALCAT